MMTWQLSPDYRPRCNELSALGMKTWQLSPNLRPMRFFIYRLQNRGNKSFVQILFFVGLLFLPHSILPFVL